MKPHPIDFVSLILVAIGALAEVANLLPSKYSGLVLMLAVGARIYTKYAGGKETAQALEEGKAVAQELKTDLAIMKAQKAEPVTQDPK